MQKLNAYREELKALTTNILSKINSRKKLVLKIQNEKHTTGEYKNFDIQREITLFNSLSNELADYSLKELLIFSLMIETQAGVELEYPAWSSQVHIDKNESSLASQINPVLLATFQKSSYATLQFNEKFQKILNPLLEK